MILNLPTRYVPKTTWIISLNQVSIHTHIFKAIEESRQYQKLISGIAMKLDVDGQGHQMSLY